MRTSRRLLLHLAFVAGGLGLWEGLVRAGALNQFFTGTPSAILSTLAALLKSPSFLGAAADSFGNMAAGYFLAVLAGAGLGLPAGYFRRVYENIRYYVQTAYSIPRLVFVPLVILWLGIGAPAKIGIIFLFAFFPVFIVAMEAARDMDRDLSDVCRVYRSGRLTTLRYLVLPAASGPVLAGTKIAVGRALTGMLLSETFGRPEGVGYLLFHYGANYEINKMMAVIVLLASLSAGLYYCVEAMEKKLVRWR